jgi:hypothetical protein
MATEGKMRDIATAQEIEMMEGGAQPSLLDQAMVDGGTDNDVTHEADQPFTFQSKMAIVVRLTQHPFVPSRGS